MELAIIRAIQSVQNPVLDFLFEAITMLAEPITLILVFTAVYWCVNKRSGELLAVTLLFSFAVNGVIKDVVKAQRPIGQPGVRSLRVHTAPGYSFPSAHAQTAATFYTSAALQIKRSWTTILAVLLPVLIALSRLYLGVHYPRDVLAGLLLGYLCAFLMDRLLLRVKRTELLYWALCLPLAAVLLLVGQGSDSFRAAGALLGFAAAISFERRAVRFNTDIPLGKKVARWGVGLLLLGGLYLLLKAVLPQGNVFILLRYGLVIFWGLGVYPWLFARRARKNTIFG